MRAIAKVDGLISWPKSFSGATFGGSFSGRCLSLARIFDQPQVGLDEQARRAAVGVIDAQAGLGIEDHRHEHRHLRRRQELAGAAALAFGKLAQQIFVGLAEDVLLHVLQSEPVLGLRIWTSEARWSSSSIRWPEVVALNSVMSMTPCRRGLTRATARTASVRYSPSPVVFAWRPRPAGLLGEKKRTSLWSARRAWPRSSRAELGYHVADFVLEHVRHALEEDQRQDVILELGRIERPADRASRLPEPVPERRDVERLDPFVFEREFHLTLGVPLRHGFPLPLDPRRECNLLDLGRVYLR